MADSDLAGRGIEHDLEVARRVQPEVEREIEIATKAPHHDLAQPGGVARDEAGVADAVDDARPVAADVPGEASIAHVGAVLLRRLRERAAGGHSAQAVP